MNVLNGKGISEGIAFGSLYFYSRAQLQIKRHHINDAAAEIKRFESARKQSVAELQQLYDKALQEAGEKEAMIFQIHQMMLEDLDYTDSVKGIIEKERINAEYAVAMTADNFSGMFAAMDDSYMRGRAADVKDASERLIKILSNTSDNLINSDEPVIVVADDLMPSETVQLDKSKLLGFITLEGSSNSHTAILARTMNIPAIIKIGDQFEVDFDGKQAIIDGFEGKVYIDPDEQTVADMSKKRDTYLEHLRLLQSLKGKENVSLDGQKVKVFANIGHVTDIDIANQNDAQGIGLFRSEFLYLESADYPTEEDQFQAYKKAAENMNGKTVIIRTLDIGADKQADYFELPKEANPAMGYRAIRICLDRTDVFKTQLRALFRASAFGKIGIMFPMIISVEEVRQIKLIVEEVKAGLRAEKTAFSDNVELGIMIETPAAAVISDLLAKEVDFFSIGTNDLTQYTLAIDRQNQLLENYYDRHHKALLRLIKLVAENAHKYGAWVGVCGELGADTSLTEAFLAMEIDELSVSPSKILDLRKKIRETRIGEIRKKILNEIEG